MSSLTIQELVEKWNRKLAETRAELEAKAAAGDVTARRILADVRGEPMVKRVDAPIPGPAAIPKPWSESAEREPGEDDR